MLTTIGLLIGCGAAGGPPTDAEVLRALPQAGAGMPGVFEVCRDDLVIVKKLVKSEAAEGTTPAGAKVRLTRTHWECPVYYTETVRAAFPFPVEVRKQRVEVIYIDKTRAGE